MISGRLKYILIILLLPVLGRAQNIRAVAELDSNSMLIGDQVSLHLELTVPAGSQVYWPMFQDTLAAGIEILRKSAIDTIELDNYLVGLHQSLVVTVFDSGSYYIPSIPFRTRMKGDTTTYFTETRPLYLEVQSIDINQDESIKPIKPPLHAPVTFAELLPWLLAFILLILIAGAVAYIIVKKRRQEPVFSFLQKPELPPYERAIRDLEDLKTRKVWQSGRVKEYYSELTDIIRIYLEGRYQVRAMEMTTHEIGESLREIDIRLDSRDRLHRMLTLADLVKFAKAQPLPVDNDQSYTDGRTFVESTRPPVIGKEDTTVENENLKPAS